jgi:hypothetical protein
MMGFSSRTSINFQMLGRHIFHHNPNDIGRSRLGKRTRNGQHKSKQLQKRELHGKGLILGILEKIYFSGNKVDGYCANPGCHPSKK